MFARQIAAASKRDGPRVISSAARDYVSCLVWTVARFPFFFFWASGFESRNLYTWVKVIFYLFLFFVVVESWRIIETYFFLVLYSEFYLLKAYIASQSSALLRSTSNTCEIYYSRFYRILYYKDCTIFITRAFLFINISNIVLR